MEKHEINLRIGYGVKKIPFSSLNYPDKEINKWKVLFERKLYNKGVESRYSSNKVIAGAGCNICQSQYFYLPGKVSQKSKKRLIPTVTANSNTYRDSNNYLKTDNTDLEFSLNGIYGIFGLMVNRKADGSIICVSSGVHDFVVYPPNI